MTNISLISLISIISSYNYVLIYLLLVASVEIGDDFPGTRDDDWLLGAEEDSPDLNYTALTHAEPRLRFLFFILYICMHILSDQYLFVMTGRSARNMVMQGATKQIVRQKAMLLMLLHCRPRVHMIQVRPSGTTQRACG
jgi:uncharacterized membrane protein YjdF